jgi:UDPglucose 6-dehydrogenase
MDIAIVGIWHLGEIYSTGVAELRHNVVGIDENEAVIKNLANGIPPLAEPALDALIAKNQKEGRLRYSTDFSEIKKCNVVWFAFDTPVDDHDDPQMEVIYTALDKATPYFADEIIFVMSSQVPVGTSEKILAAIRAKRPEVKVHYAYTPENLRLGDAVRCFMEPGRIVIGASDDAAREALRKIFSPLHTELVEMSVPSAEMAKHALNAFLATSLSFINDIADICDVEGADVLDVVRALRSDPRIGKGAFLGAGLGFSGGTLGRDLRALGAAAKDHGISAPVIASVWEKNAGREKELAEQCARSLGGLQGKRVAVFGVTYKAGTTTLRRSRSIELGERLSAAGAEVRLHDPHAAKAELAGVTTLPFFTDPYEAAKDCDGIFVVTPWPDFKELDFERLAKECHKNAVVFDGNNFLYNESEVKIRPAGMVYKGVGRG